MTLQFRSRLFCGRKCLTAPLHSSLFAHSSRQESALSYPLAAKEEQKGYPPAHNLLRIFPCLSIPIRFSAVRTGTGLSIVDSRSAESAASNTRWYRNHVKHGDQTGPCRDDINHSHVKLRTCHSSQILLCIPLYRPLMRLYQAALPAYRHVILLE